MRRGQLILSLFLTFLSVVAVGFCIWSLVVLGETDSALVGAVILLGLAQMLAYVSRVRQHASQRGNIADLMGASSDMARDHARLNERLERLEKESSGRTSAAIGRLSQQVRSLEHSVTALSRARLARRPGRAVDGPGHNAAVRREPSGLAAGRFSRDELEVFLEPVVRINGGQTAYYRASVAVRADDGRFVPVDWHEAARQGENGMIVFERIAPVVRALAARQRRIGVFCPVSDVALETPGFVDDLLAFVKRNLDIAGLLVVEISQDALARLDKTGAEGLATMARKGATLSLCEARMKGPDGETLASLGFGFVDMDVNELTRLMRASPPAGISRPAELARQDISLIAANVEDTTQAEALAELVSLARGPAYSPPRLVRRDIATPSPRRAVA